MRVVQHCLSLLQVVQHCLHLVKEGHPVLGTQGHVPTQEDGDQALAFGAVLPPVCLYGLSGTCTINCLSRWCKWFSLSVAGRVTPWQGQGPHSGEMTG